MDLRSIRIGTRLAIGFGLILAILVITFVLSSVLNSRNKENMVVGLELTGKKEFMANSMKGALLETGITMRNIVMQSDVGLMQKDEAHIKELRTRYEQLRSQLQVLGLNESEKKIVANVAALDAQVEGSFKEALGQALAFNTEGALKILVSKIDPLNQQTFLEINKLVQLQKEATAAVISNSVTEDNRLMFSLMAINVIALIIGIGCAWVITRSIILPLQGAMSIAKTVAAGVLTSNAEVEGKDEISELLFALNEMSRSLTKTVSEVRLSTETITVASREIALGNADLSSRTELQAGSLEETASTMEELTGIVRKNADNAREANQLAMSASDVAGKGGSIVSSVVVTMGSIKDSSQKIVDIIAVIDGIAFQTNILALNAAVEAARAGEQGRGFAVVAAEVRNLAHRSAGAAKQIKELIRDSVETVDAGNKLVIQAGETMKLIVSSIQNVATIMSEITEASQDQSNGIGEVNNAIRQMDEMTQQNAALVEQAAAAAESLEEQAQNLLSSVNIFKLDNSQPVSAKPFLRKVKTSALTQF